MADGTFLMNLALGTGYTVFGGFIGVLLLGIATHIIPKMVDKVTPDIDDEKELARGNTAMGVYMGLITGSIIIGVSIIVAAAIIAGLM